MFVNLKRMKKKKIGNFDKPKLKARYIKIKYDKLDSYHFINFHNIFRNQFIINYDILFKLCIIYYINKNI